MTWLNGIVLATALVLPQETPRIDGISTSQAAVKTAEKTFGPEHPVTAMMLRNLALSYEEAGLYDQAEVTAKQSLAILEAVFGAADVSLTPSLNVLTETYVAEGRYRDARRVAMRAVEIGPDAEAHYATALHNLGAVFESVGRFDEAREYYQRALAAREMWLTANHPHVAMTRAALKRMEARVETREASRQLTADAR